MIKGWLGAALAIGWLGYWGAVGERDVFKAGSERHLFVDDLLIESSRDVQLRLNPPRKTYERSLIAEHPWEDGGVGYTSILKDGDLYKMWYRCDALGRREQGEKGMRANWCYAVSRDGIHWEKPMLDLVDFRGSKHNNIVIENAFGTVFPDPQRIGGDRFKFAGIRKPDRGLVLFSSPDGLNWKPMHETAVLSKGYFDTQNQVFWDARLSKYVAYVRRWDPPDPHHDPESKSPLCCRKVGRSETADLNRWPEPEIVIGLEADDPMESDLYTPCVIPYPGASSLYFMFPSAYFHYDPARHDNHRNLGPLDIRLAVSRDGIRWNRTQRSPYVGLGVDRAFDSLSLYMGVGMLVEGPEIWMYYTGYDFLHGDVIERLQYSGVVSRLVQRLDGFISADGAYSGGQLTTRPLTFDGTHLLLNIDTGALGNARVEILDESGRPLPGFSGDACDLINGNVTNQRVSWDGKGDLSGLRGRTVKLRFHLRDAKLFAFQFAP